MVTCPAHIEAETQRGESWAEVSWSPAAALDNSIYLPTLTIIPAMTSPAQLSIGHTLVTYVAEDLNGNKRKCSFSITVIGIRILIEITLCHNTQ